MNNIVITGAGKGMGRAMALKFAKAGNKVAICARTLTDLQEVASHYPTQIIYYSCDISIKAEVLGFADFIKQNFTQVDVLINNAGTYIPGKFHEEKDGTFEALMNLNVAAAYHLTRELVPMMMAKKQGHIMNVCSTASMMGYANGGSYCISKFALYGMNKVLREELKPHNIKVTAILPGATLTQSWAGTDLPESRFLNPNDVADMVYNCTQLSASAVVEDLVIRPLMGDIV
ncbi:MAG: SDR family oxidoreductase [Bacteroidetes bacterium]|nr:SDR family oxidoreductase [Bacteroidota bacterium]